MKKLGFGCMRMPTIGDEVDLQKFGQMIDLFLSRGFCYFDTAHGYLRSRSETALRECLVRRYPRNSYLIADKLTGAYFREEADIRPLFFRQLDACGVEYFDYYLMHSQNAENFEKFKSCRAYETALELKQEGRLRHFGISFHDRAEVLDRILQQYPQIEVVQIQFNYADYFDPAIQSRLCYEVCRKHNKPVIVMEPVKGGLLANLPEDARRIFAETGISSPASCAIRFAAGFEGVMMVLSGMGSIEQVMDNTAAMADCKPLSDAENAAIDRVRAFFSRRRFIACTGCGYCEDGCPKAIRIPGLFACLNAKREFNDPNSGYYYEDVHTVNAGKASDCIGCGKCEKICPQHLSVRALLKEVADEFENAGG